MRTVENNTRWRPDDTNYMIQLQISASFNTSIFSPVTPIVTVTFLNYFDVDDKCVKCNSFKIILNTTEKLMN